MDIMTKVSIFKMMMKKYSKDLLAKMTMMRFKDSREFDYLFGK